MEEAGANRFDCRIYVLSLPLSFGMGYCFWMWQFKDNKKSPNKQQLFSYFSREQLSFLQIIHYKGINGVKCKEGNPFTFGSPSCNGDMCGGYLACRAWMNSPTVCIWLTTKRPGSLSKHKCQFFLYQRYGRFHHFRTFFYNFILLNES